MRNMSQNTIELLLLLLIVAIAAGAYRFGYQYYVDKAEVVNLQSRAIQAHIDSMKVGDDNHAQLEQAIADTDARKHEILAKYGAGNTPEKTLAILVEFEKALPVKIPNMDFGHDEEFFASTAVGSDGSPAVRAFRQTVPFTFSTNYRGFKRLADYINNYPERMNIRDFSVTYVAGEDRLEGSMSLNLYSVQDADHVYEAPEFDGIKIGKDNIFK